MASLPSEEKRRILLAISGSIAAYKAADVVSKLVSQGHEVQCLLTESASQFVTPTVLETLSRKPVESRLFGPGISGTEHIRLARWAELIVFAPATANLIAKLALGLCDDLVTTVAMASEAPWLLAPAMNTVMWNQPVFQESLAKLRSRGARFVEPAEGTLACGEQGVGKMAAPEVIVDSIFSSFARTEGDLKGLRVLITAGPTTSAIDAVRYLTNRSTGKMGAAMAEEALARGASVHYVLGVDKGVVRPAVPGGAGSRFRLVEVETAEQMSAAALEALPQVDGVVATAAVLDYRVASSAPGKLKRAEDPVELSLVPSVDVLGRLREHARPGQFFVGFAAETERLREAALQKLAKKRLDLLFANVVARAEEKLDTGFGVETNGGILLSRDGGERKISVQGKRDVAREIWNEVLKLRGDRRP